MGEAQGSGGAAVSAAQARRATLAPDSPGLQLVVEDLTGIKPSSAASTFYCECQLQAAAESQSSAKVRTQAVAPEKGEVEWAERVVFNEQATRSTDLVFTVHEVTGDGKDSVFSTGRLPSDVIVVGPAQLKLEDGAVLRVRIARTHNAVFLTLQDVEGLSGVVPENLAEHTKRPFVTCSIMGTSATEFESATSTTDENGTARWNTSFTIGRYGGQALVFEISSQGEKGAQPYLLGRAILPAESVQRGSHVLELDDVFGRPNGAKLRIEVMNDVTRPDPQPEAPIKRRTNTEEASDRPPPGFQLQRAKKWIDLANAFRTSTLSESEVRLQAAELREKGRLGAAGADAHRGSSPEPESNPEKDAPVPGIAGVQVKVRRSDAGLDTPEPNPEPRPDLSSNKGRNKGSKTAASEGNRGKAGAASRPSGKRGGKSSAPVLKTASRPRRNERAAPQQEVTLAGGFDALAASAALVPEEDATLAAAAAVAAAEADDEEDREQEEADAQQARLEREADELRQEIARLKLDLASQAPGGNPASTAGGPHSDDFQELARLQMQIEAQQEGIAKLLEDSEGIQALASAGLLGESALAGDGDDPGFGSIPEEPTQMPSTMQAPPYGTPQAAGLDDPLGSGVAATMAPAAAASASGSPLYMFGPLRQETYTRVVASELGTILSSNIEAPLSFAYESTSFRGARSSMIGDSPVQEESGNPRKLFGALPKGGSPLPPEFSLSGGGVVASSPHDAAGPSAGDSRSARSSRVSAVGPSSNGVRRQRQSIKADDEQDLPAFGSIFPDALPAGQEQPPGSPPGSMRGTAPRTRHRICGSLPRPASPSPTREQLVFGRPDLRLQAVPEASPRTGFPPAAADLSGRIAEPLEGNMARPPSPTTRCRLMGHLPISEHGDNVQRVRENSPDYAGGSDVLDSDAIYNRWVCSSDTEAPTDRRQRRDRLFGADRILGQHASGAPWSSATVLDGASRRRPERGYGGGVDLQDYAGYRGPVASPASPPSSATRLLGVPPNEWAGGLTYGLGLAGAIPGVGDAAQPEATRPRRGLGLAGNPGSQRRSSMPGNLTSRPAGDSSEPIRRGSIAGGFQNSMAEDHAGISMQASPGVSGRGHWEHTMP